MARLLKALPIKVIESIGALFGIVVASYTGVLLAATAVPVWASTQHPGTTLRHLRPLYSTGGYLVHPLAGSSYSS